MVTKFAGGNTLVLDWQIMANQVDLTLTNIQGLRLAYDNTVLRLIRWDAAGDYSNMMGDMFTKMPQAGNLGVYGYGVPAVYGAKNDIGYTGFLGMALEIGGSFYNCPLNTYVSLLKVRFAFHAGKSEADLTPNSIRMLTATELQNIAQYVSILLNTTKDGGKSYTYGLQNGGEFTGGDELEAPIIE